MKDCSILIWKRRASSTKANYTSVQLARTSSELSPTVARHEKGVSFWEVESIAKGWKTLRTAVYNSTVSEIEPVHPFPPPPHRYSYVPLLVHQDFLNLFLGIYFILAHRKYHDYRATLFSRCRSYTAENRFSSNRFILHFSARELDHRRFKCTPFELQFSIAQFQLLFSRRLFITMRYIFVIYLKEKFNNISPHRLNSIIFL